MWNSGKVKVLLEMHTSAIVIIPLMAHLKSSLGMTMHLFIDLVECKLILPRQGHRFPLSYVEN